MNDITAPEHVQIQIRSDGKVVWINVDGICVLRACRIGRLKVNDDRMLSPLMNEIAGMNDEEAAQLLTELRRAK